MSSELRDTGEKHPIYESVRRCDILERSLYWKVLQDHCRRRWWFWDRTPACREHTDPRADADSRINAAIPGRTLIGPVLKVHIIQFLGTHGIEIHIPSTTTPNRTSWVVICRGRNRYVDESHLRDPGHNPTSSEIRVERLILKESELCSTEMEQSRIEETHATHFGIPTNPVFYSKEVILVGKRKWNDIPAYKSFKGDSLQAEISKLVMGLVRHCVQDERETDGADHWNSMVPQLRNAFQKSGGRTFSITDWLHHICEGSNKMRFQYGMNSQNSFLFFRAIQRHTGGNLIEFEFMGHVAFPLIWKEFLFHRVCSSNVTSILKSELIAGGREKQRRKTDHLLHTSQPGRWQSRRRRTYQNRE